MVDYPVSVCAILARGSPPVSTLSCANVSNAQVGASASPAFCFAHTRNSLCLEKDSGTPQPILSPTTLLTDRRCLLPIQEDKSLELTPDLPYSLAKGSHLRKYQIFLTCGSGPGGSQGHFPSAPFYSQSPWLSPASLTAACYVTAQTSLWLDHPSQANSSSSTQTPTPMSSLSFLCMTPP